METMIEIIRATEGSGEVLVVGSLAIVALVVFGVVTVVGLLGDAKEFDHE